MSRLFSPTIKYVDTDRVVLVTEKNIEWKGMHQQDLLLEINLLLLFVQNLYIGLTGTVTFVARHWRKHKKCFFIK